ncbi:MAG: PAS-domain containing protein, partial [Pseudomonadota bacterium]
MTPTTALIDGFALFGPDLNGVLADHGATLALALAVAGLAGFSVARLLQRLGTGGDALILHLDPDDTLSVTEPMRLRSALGAVPHTRGALADCFGAEAGSVAQALTRLLSVGEPFDLLAAPPGRAQIRLSGRLSGLVAELTLARSSPDIAALHAARAEIERLRRALRTADDRLATAPVALAELGPDGVPRWTNRAFEVLTRQRLAAAAVHRLLEVDGADPIALTAATGDAPLWYRCLKARRDDGTLIAALEADAEMAAEGALSHFMNTLADTFAHLGTGLAVFDGHQHLIMFNPALCVLLDLDPVALARRPSLRAFLDALRQNRRVPETRDFPLWRDRILRIGRPGGVQSLQEDWALTSGQTFRITARHHGEGSVVFLFEDISKLVRLERRYRQEIEISQTTLDSLVDGVAVFDTAGALVFANAA